jgi:two-component system chemotaxis response regulator CheY
LRTCLIVEDSSTIRRVLREMMRRLHFFPLEAKSAEEAFAICTKRLPEVLLVDWNLPGIDGVGLVELVRALPGGRDPKVLMCTVESSMAHIERAMSAGADEYIMKPFTMEALADKLSLAGLDISLDEPEIEAQCKDERARLALDHSRHRRQFSRMAIAAMTVADSEVKTYTPGQAIYRKGDTPDFGYILMSGAVQISTMRNGAPFVLGELEPYQLFGELALIEHFPRPVTATAMQTCEVMQISPERFQAKLDALDPFMRCWVESLSDTIFSLLAITSADDQKKSA